MTSYVDTNYHERDGGLSNENNPNFHNNNNDHYDNDNHKNSVNGTTSLIRKKLGFSDEMQWKRFSSRRLQLVETLSLSSKKASEQDNEIRVCAKTLMNEFKFAENTLPEFDKLVRMAIQSVRRNKKRSQKRLASKITDEAPARSGSYDENSSHTNNPSPTSYDSGSYYNNSNKDKSKNGNNGYSTDDDRDPKRRKIDTDNLKFLSEIMIDEEESHGKGKYSTKIDMGENSDLASKLAINSLVTPALQTRDFLPSIRQLNLNTEFNNAAHELLSSIKKSKTCFEFTNSATMNSVRSFDTVENLGSTCITSSILLTLERWFDDLSLDSSSYIKLKLNGDLMLSSIIKTLDKNSIDVNRLSDYVASQLFKKLVGGCVKDFGFNEVLYPLCDIFHSILLKDYPLASKGRNNSATNPANHMQTMSSLLHSSNGGIDGGEYQYFNSTSVIDSTINKPVLSTSHSSSILPIPTSSPAVSGSNGTPPINVTPPPPPLSSTRVPTGFSSALSRSSSQGASQTQSQSDSLITVIIKFNVKELKFIYPSNTCSPPTIMELITNSKTAFGIVNTHRILKIRDKETGTILNNDFELEKLFNLTKSKFGKLIELELIYPNVQDYLYLNYDTSASASPNMNTVNTPDPIATNATTVSNNSNSSSGHPPDITTLIPPLMSTTPLPSYNNGSIPPPLHSQLNRIQPMGGFHQLLRPHSLDLSSQPSQQQQQQQPRSRLPFMKFQPLL